MVAGVPKYFRQDLKSSQARSAFSKHSRRVCSRSEVGLTTSHFSSTRRSPLGVGGLLASYCLVLVLLLPACKNSVVPPENNQPIDPPILNDTAWTYLGLANETISAIAIHPSDSRIMYAGSSFDFSAGTNGKLFKSTNGGATWDTLLWGGGYQEIVIDPSNPEIVYAVPGGIVKSADGGKTWQNKSNGIFIDFETNVLCLVLDPVDPNVLYAGTGGFHGGDLYKTTDGGENWFSIASNDTIPESKTAITVDPSNHNTVYVGISAGLLFRSTDAGGSWTQIDLGVVGRRIFDICVDWTDSQQILVGLNLIGIWKSDDGGNTWQEFSEGLSDTVSALRILKRPNSETIFVIAAQPDGSGVYRRQAAFWQGLGVGDIVISSSSDMVFRYDGSAIYLGAYRGLYGITL